MEIDFDIVMKKFLLALTAVVILAGCSSLA